MSWLPSKWIITRFTEQQRKGYGDTQQAAQTLRAMDKFYESLVNFEHKELVFEFAASEVYLPSLQKIEMAVNPTVERIKAEIIRAKDTPPTNRLWHIFWVEFGQDVRKGINCDKLIELAALDVNKKHLHEPLPSVPLRIENKEVAPLTKEQRERGAKAFKLVQAGRFADWQTAYNFLESKSE